MSGRIFQNVVLQIKEATDRVIGVIDAEGTVISCSDLGLIGRKWPEYVGVLNRADGAMVAMDGRTFHALSGLGSRFDYAVFTVGEDEIGRTVCAMASVALNGAKNAAILACQILSLSEPALADRLAEAKEEMKAQITQKDARLREELDKALKATAQRLDPELGEQDLPALALELALRSYADKLACQRILDLLRQSQPEPIKKSKKERKEHKA